MRSTKKVQDKKRLIKSMVMGKKPKNRLETPIDRIMEIIEQRGKITLKELSQQIGCAQPVIENMLTILEKHQFVELVYPAMPTQQPYVKFVAKAQEEKEAVVSGKVLEEYSFTVDYVPVHVKIVEPPKSIRPHYIISWPKPKPYTKILLQELRDRIASRITIEPGELTDPKKSMALRDKFFNTAKQLLAEFLAGCELAENIVAGMLLHEMYGIGKMELFMGDNNLEEVVVNSSKTPITVYHRNYGWMMSNVYIESEEQILTYAAQIARKVGREITTLNPILDAHLISGDRVNATLAPISSFGNTITIRRFARRPWTIIDFLGKSHTMNEDMIALLWMAMQYELNILVAGGTASGKTSALNAMCAMIPAYHRVISIEDVREIMLPEFLHWNWVPMTTRNPNPEGLGGVTMLDLMHSSLRMRPDRIVVGEVRRRKEAEVLFEAMHTGHSVYSTIHANSSRQVLRRLTEPPMEIPPIEIEAVDLLVVQYRDRKTNRRRTLEISEIESGTEGKLGINLIYRWSARTDTWNLNNSPTNFLEKINLHTGMSITEINEDLEQRKTVLRWMLEHNITEINQVGKVINEFYIDQEHVVSIAEKNDKPEKILEA